MILSLLGRFRWACIVALSFSLCYAATSPSSASPRLSGSVLDPNAPGILLDDQSVILRPLSNTTGPEIALVFIQGADIPPERYIPLCQEIQKRLHYRTWVGIPSVLFQLPFEPLIPPAVDGILKSLEKAGMSTSTHLFAGHSLGGAMLPDYIVDSGVETPGVMLFGSYLTRSFYPVHEHFPSPTLTVGGTLDGLTRITRVAESYYHQIESSKAANESTRYPVVVLEGVSHMQFASGKPPSAVEARDLVPTATYAQAHAEAAHAAAMFIDVQLNASIASGAELSALVAASGDVVKPIIDAFRMEGNYNYNKPCYERDSGTWGLPCIKGCPWTQQVAVPVVSGINGSHIRDADSFRDVASVLHSYRPSVDNSCAGEPPACVLQATSVSENVYPWLERFDGAYYPESSEEIRAEMKSRQSMLHAYHGRDVPFNTTDRGTHYCREINEKAMSWAMNAMAETAASQRYAQYGQPLLFGDDHILDNSIYGPEQWIYSPLKYTPVQQSGIQAIEITSPAYITPMSGDIDGSNEGMHYCKLLSPARAIEWMYVDGLRLHASLSGKSHNQYNSNRLYLRPPAIPSGAVNVACVLIGRADVPLSAYSPLVSTLQSAFASASVPIAMWTAVIRDGDAGMIEPVLHELALQGNTTMSFMIGHSMSVGGVSVQQYARANPADISCIVLLSAFLQRVQRPLIQECLPRAKYQPEVEVDYPLGYLKDGVHNCSGSPLTDYPVPALTIGGDLDGIVRITRIAEAFYTQQVVETNPKRRASLPVSVVEGMNHGAILMGGDGVLPPKVRSMDLKSELSSADARVAVSNEIVPFVVDVVRQRNRSRGVGDIAVGDGMPSAHSSKSTTSSAFFDPMVEAFVSLEANWFFTGMDDEHGHSRWSALAQEWMAQPLPVPYEWNTTNAFHLLSDEEFIPPYYRHKHRAHVEVDRSNKRINASTVLQQRFIEISVEEAGIGLDGWSIIKEEKLNILTAINDTGEGYTSTIELATKLASRQKVYNESGYPSPQTLDDGNRCAAINEKAYQWALNHTSPHAFARFKKYGIPMVMGPDRSPTIPAGPWWIWTYLNYNMNGTDMVVSSYKAFFALDANPYGAGNHYCKLLSPARALEWIYIDSLRQHMHA